MVLVQDCGQTSLSVPRPALFQPLRSGRDPLSRMRAYQLSAELIADSWTDAEKLRHHRVTEKVSGQLYAAVSSIAANISEGYSRSSGRDRARTAEPDNAAIIDSYGWVLHRLGRSAEALVELRRAFALQKDPEIAAHLGEVLWLTGHKDEARKYFNEGRKLDPQNRSLRRALARTGAA